MTAPGTCDALKPPKVRTEAGELRKQRCCRANNGSGELSSVVERVAVAAVLESRVTAEGHRR